MVNGPGGGMGARGGVFGGGGPGAVPRPSGAMGGLAAAAARTCSR